MVWLEGGAVLITTVEELVSLIILWKLRGEGMTKTKGSLKDGG